LITTNSFIYNPTQLAVAQGFAGHLDSILWLCDWRFQDILDAQIEEQGIQFSLWQFGGNFAQSLLVNVYSLLQMIDLLLRLGQIRLLSAVHVLPVNKSEALNDMGNTKPQINPPVGQIEGLTNGERDIRGQLIGNEHKALVGLLRLGTTIAISVRMAICRRIAAVPRLHRLGNKTEELLHTLLVRTVRDVVERKLVQDLVGARLLDGHALDANGDLQLLELLLGARLRLLHLLGKLQLPNGLLDHLDALGLVHAQVTKELKGGQTMENSEKNVIIMFIFHFLY